MSYLQAFLTTAFLTLGLAFSAFDVQTEVHSDETFGKPLTLISSGDLNEQDKVRLLGAATRFYEFWNTGNAKLLESVLSPDFTDRALPPGRPQGPTGPLIAIRQFRRTVPDLRCQVTQQIIARDRVVSHLRFTGHFLGRFGNLEGRGQLIDFIATDILRIDQSGRIAENWHIEDNFTFLKQIGAVKLQESSADTEEMKGNRKR